MDLDDLDGCIESIHVKNFFCHDNLEIRFNKNINFIVGRNGSGKSAILTALVVGLGARAAATSRGTSIQAFIKKGTNSAMIEIKIKNSSAKGYKHHIYGDSITIIRHINSSGSSYKVKSDSGEVISTKYEEVSSIILALDIQVDNPISVLNQDDARSFHASDAKKKYQLFRKATNLDQTEANYVKALENCKKAKAIWEIKSEVFQGLEKELRKWESTYEMLQSREEVEARQKHLQNEYYWSEIAEYEKDVNTLILQYDKQNNKINKFINRIEEIQNNHGSDSGVISVLKEKLVDKKSKCRIQEEKITAFENISHSIQSEYKTIQQKCNKYNELLTREKNKIKDLKREIDNIASNEGNSNRIQLENEVKNAADIVESIKARLNTAKHYRDQCYNDVNVQTQSLQDKKDRLSYKQQALKKLKMELSEIDSRSTDSLSVYGRNMVELTKRVRDAVHKNKFSSPPRGPVGAHIKVKDKKWAGVLEHIIGGAIHTFCVNSAEDSRALFKIMEEVYGNENKPGVTCSKFLPNVHDVSRNLVHTRQYSAALNALIITDPVIANFLIDNIGLENILLVPDHDEAMRLSDTVENVPQNCNKIVTLDCTEYYPAPSYKCYGGSGNISKYLQSSTADRRRQLNEDISRCTKEVECLMKEVREAEQLVATAEQESSAATNKQQQLINELHKREVHYRRAKDALSDLSPHQSNVLLEELEIAKKKVESIEKEQKDFLGKDTEYEMKLDETSQKLKIAQNMKFELLTEIESITAEINEEQIKVERDKNECNKIQRCINEEKVKLNKLKEVVDEKKELVSTKTNSALKLCDKIENARDKNEVVSELKKLQVKLKSLQVDGMSKTEVQAKLLALQKKHKTTKYILDKLLSLITEVQKTSDQHLKYCLNVQTSIARNVQYSFRDILDLNNYSGTMHIDAVKGVLELSCSGRDSCSTRLATSTSSLSGGERSYATVAFIMALWECVELPFYFLDEFDVFMDNVNRKIVMELLIDHAMKNPNRQFVFLTPQDASSVQAGPNIKIHRMADPRSQ